MRLRTAASGLARLRRPLLIAVLAIGVVLPTAAAHADPSLSQIQQQIASDSAKLERIVEQYNKVNEQLKASQAQAAAMTARLQPLQQQMDEASARVSLMAANAYKGGLLTSDSALLASGSPDVFIQRLDTLDQIAKAQQHEVDQFIEAKSAHDTEAGRLATVIVTQRKQRDDIAAKRAAINKDLDRLYALRRQAYGRAQTSSGGGGHASAPYVAGKAGIAVRYAYNALGKPYEWAADGPGSYDCSGLTMAAWRAAGVQLPHNAEMQWHAMPHISRGSLKPGDLIFYNGLGHVAIYVGSGKVIQAPTFGENVKLSSMDFMTPYGYGRP